MVIGIYFFKFPNHFAFGGVTGFSTVFSQLLHCSASTFTTAANYALLVLGFIFLGKSVGIRTVYATIVMSVSLQALDALVPMHGTLTDQPMLELVFAIMLPAIGSAILFNIDASSGGTDVIAMILKKVHQHEHRFCPDGSGCGGCGPLVCNVRPLHRSVLHHGSGGQVDGGG